MTPALYNIDDTVYLRASAGAGFLEAVVIGAITATQDQAGWMYGTVVGGRRQVTATFGDANTHADQHVLMFAESELVNYCVALKIVNDYLAQQTAMVAALQNAQCKQ